MSPFLDDVGDGKILVTLIDRLGAGENHQREQTKVTRDTMYERDPLIFGDVSLLIMVFGDF